MSDKSRPKTVPRYKVENEIHDLISAGKFAAARQLHDEYNASANRLNKFRQGDFNFPSGYEPDYRSDLVKSFRSGDLVYGLDKIGGRPRHLENILNADGAPSFATVDDLNHQFLGVKKGERYPTPKNPAERHRDFPPMDVKDIQASRRKAGELKGFLDSRDKNPSLTPEGSEDHVNTRIKRSIKAGMEFTVAQGHSIHFELNDISMDDVVNKRGDYGNSFTASELRKAYRMRKSEHANGIKFYVRGVETKAPWETNSTLWDKYKPKSENRGVQSSIPDQGQGAASFPNLGSASSSSPASSQRSGSSLSPSNAPALQGFPNLGGQPASPAAAQMPANPAIGQPVPPAGHIQQAGQVGGVARPPVPPRAPASPGAESEGKRRRTEEASNE